MKLVAVILSNYEIFIWLLVQSLWQNIGMGFLIGTKKFYYNFSTHLTWHLPPWLLPENGLLPKQNKLLSKNQNTIQKTDEEESDIEKRNFVKKQGWYAQAGPMPSWILPQDSQADRTKSGGAGTKLQAPPTSRLANRAHARCMLAACQCMPAACQPHAAHAWLIASIGHGTHTTALVRQDH